MWKVVPGQSRGFLGAACAKLEEHDPKLELPGGTSSGEGLEELLETSSEPEPADTTDPGAGLQNLRQRNSQDRD